MTSKERLKRCYFHQETDRPGIYSRTGFPPDDPTYDRLKAYLAKHTDLKAGWSGLQCERGYQMETRKEPCCADYERKIEIMHTPAGELQCSVLLSLKGQPGFHETFFVKSADDAEKYLSLPMPEIGGDVSSFFSAVAMIGDRGIVDVGLGLNPGGFAAELCGSENFALLSLTDRDIIHRLCERRMAMTREKLKFLLARGVGPFFSMAGEEYIVPPLHGPRDFADFNVRYDKPIIDLVHEAGCRMHIHAHGSIKRVFQGFLDMGADVLHPFEPPPQGDISASEAKKRARGKICLEGNIQISRLYDCTPEQIRRETEELIRDAFDDQRGLIVCPTASPYVRGKGNECFPQYKEMIDAVLDFKG